MAVEGYQIISVEKACRLTPWEHVTHIFYFEPGGIPRLVRYYDAIRTVEEQTTRFFVVRDEKRVELRIGHNVLGEKTLRAFEGDTEIDILVSLPDHRDVGNTAVTKPPAGHR